MFIFFINFLSGISITNIVVNSTLLDGFRKFLIEKLKNYFDIELLISCMMCTGFWIGCMIGCFNDLGILNYGLIISLGSFTYGKFIEFLDSRTDYYILKSQSLSQNLENKEK